MFFINSLEDLDKLDERHDYKLLAVRIAQALNKKEDKPYIKIVGKIKNKSDKSNKDVYLYNNDSEFYVMDALEFQEKDIEEKDIEENEDKND